MKNRNYLFLFCAIISIFIVGCSNEMENNKRDLDDSKSIGEEGKLVDPKEVTIKEIQAMDEILSNIDWENQQVSMTRPPDYRFTFGYENSQAEDVLYELWTSPNKEKDEIVIDAESKYAQLDKAKSAALIEIITREKSANIK